MVMDNGKSIIPITTNCTFAMRLDIEAEQEHIIIGELPEVLRYLRGHASAKTLVNAKRPIGTFILECSKPIATQLADVRAALSSSTGKKKSPYFEKSREILYELWRSDNLVYRYVAVRIWQEYHRACKDDERDLYGNIETISLPLMFNLQNDILDWQQQEPQNPMGCLSNDYFLHPASVLYAKGKALTEYMAADLSLLPLVVYYLKTVYNTKTYIQSCKRCGKLFRAKTANIATFCSDKCKREQNKENKRRFDEKAKDIPYETAYETNYMYWYNRVKKLRQNAPDTDKLAKVETAFKTFRDEAIQKKKVVADGKADAGEYMGWLLVQRDTIDGLMERE